MYNNICRTTPIASTTETIGSSRSSAYLDDIILFDVEWQEHLANIRNAMSFLQQHGIYLGIKKCCFGVEEIAYLGFHISYDSISIDPKRCHNTTPACPDGHQQHTALSWLHKLFSAIHTALRRHSSTIIRLVKERHTMAMV